MYTFAVEVTSLRDQSFRLLGFIQAESVAAAIEKLGFEALSGDKYKLPPNLEEQVQNNSLGDKPVFRVSYLFPVESFSDLVIELSKCGYFKT